MNSSNRFLHAKHNEKVCNFLQQKPEFSDWIITTAFYSALHYVTHKIFPLSFELNGKKINCDTFDVYCRYNNPKKISKHEFRKELVEIHCQEIADIFDRLHDLSNNARYVDYKLDRKDSDLARASLKRIKEFCTK